MEGGGAESSQKGISLQKMEFTAAAGLVHSPSTYVSSGENADLVR
jgi:hypothetical protein